MKDLFSLLMAPLDMAGNYEQRKVDRTELKNGITVSTAMTSDMGYETALCDPTVHPVERYPNREAAVKGHAKWVSFAKKANNGDRITKLGFGDLVEDTTVQLRVKGSR